MLERYGYRGRHRAPSAAGRTAARLVAAGAAAPLALALAGPAEAAGSVWDRVAECESGGRWDIDTGNGYYGGLQFSLSTWRAFGGSGMPQDASPAAQVEVARRTLAVQGPGAWPVCSRKAGLTRANGAAAGGGGGSGAVATPRAPARTGTNPAPVATAPAAPSPPTRTGGTPARGGGGVHTVRAGETLGRIAADHQVPGGWRALAAANTDVISNPNRIYPGQRLDVTP